MRYVGLIPAAGRATRLGNQSTSKEVIPIRIPLDAGDTPKVAIDHLLEALSVCPIEGVYVVIRDSKWDIARHCRDGSRYGVSIAYVMMGLPYGPPFTLDQVYSFLGERNVLLGFPDIIFEPLDAFRRLTSRLENDAVEIVLGLFPTDRPSKMDMVRYDVNGHIVELEIKPAVTDLQYAWAMAAWTPVFTQFLHDYVVKNSDYYAQPDIAEPQIGTVLQAAIKGGIPAAAEIFGKGWVIDIGSPDDLERIRSIKMSTRSGHE